MKITIHNYEAYFLDFVEGRLDNSSTLELLVFLNNHPDLKDELESFKDVKVTPSQMMFQDKESLKKFSFSSGINPNNFGDYCIAYHERILSNSESEKFFTYLEQNPEMKHDFELFGKTYLVADKDIMFEARSFLKKKLKASVGGIILRWSAVAASIILAISIFYKSPVSKTTVPKESEIAVNHKIDHQVPESVSDIPDRVAPEKMEKTTSGKKRSLHTYVLVEAPVRENQLAYIQPVTIATIPDATRNSEDELILPPRYGNAENLIDHAEYRDKSKNEINGKRKITLWDVAEIGLKGYNQLSEKDIFLYKETDENGKVTVLAIETANGRYGFETKN